jgi:hypothetical protein
MRVRWVLLVTLFLVFVADAGDTYEQMAGPFSWAHYLLLEALPDKIRGIDHITAVCLLIAWRSPDGRGPRVAPVRTALLLAAATTVIWFVYGIATGGGAWEASWQTYLMLSGILMAFAIAAAFRTPEHYALLWKMILWAAAYRAVMCCLFYALYIHTMRLQPPPEFLTSHDDTVLWVVAILFLVLRVIETRSFGRRLPLFLFLGLLGLAVLFNQRRIAWVSLTMGIVILLALLPPSRQKRRTMRLVYAMLPVLVLYVVIGWGRTERVFKPLLSFATVSTQEDNSTKARNMENLGLIATANANNQFMGSGWGHPYIEVYAKYTIRFFKLWPYIPHNSVLGLLAYTGILGFYGYWLIYPTAMFFNARMARMAKAPLIRRAGLMGAIQLVVCANQFYGDMGIYYAKAVYIMALAHAVALRLPLSAELWPAPKGLRRPTPPPAATPAVDPMGRGDPA